VTAYVDFAILKHVQFRLQIADFRLPANPHAEI
jgi:hypothetical protein